MNLHEVCSRCDPFKVPPTLARSPVVTGTGGFLTLRPCLFPLSPLQTGAGSHSEAYEKRGAGKSSELLSQKEKECILIFLFNIVRVLKN